MRSHQLESRRCYCVNIHACGMVPCLRQDLDSGMDVHAMTLTLQQFLLTPMGVLAPGSAHARPSARPPNNMSGNYPAHMSEESPSNIFPIPQKHSTALENTPLCPPKYSIVQGVGGGSPILFFCWNPNIFVT